MLVVVDEDSVGGMIGGVSMPVWCKTIVEE